MAVTTTTLAAVLVGAVALYLLLVGARVTVQRLVNVAQGYGVSEAVIGLTVVAVGTSLPEIAANVTASVGSLTGSLDPAVASATVLGGTVGSSVVQQTLLVGAFLLGAGRVTLSRSFVRSSYVPMVLSAALTLALAVDGTISRPDGLLLVGAFLVYLYYTYDRRERTVIPAELEVENADVRTDAAIALGGLAVVMTSAYVALAALEVLVASLGLGGSLVGVVTIGAGSALPELSTVTESVRRNRPTLALGTLVGSNVVNLLVGVGLGAAISGYRVPPAVVFWDLPVMVAVGVGAFVYVTRVSDGVLRRRDATAFVVAYFGFLTGHILLFPGG
ncbi:sodium:calcium antiporter [Halorussus rarus]|uniref:sodium:calcium antiporter n=1 Tax=Halorussus TaxID=1070314 RepID=UPI000E212CEA|nr:sodium:calcium antiporter [Halorussus rarus]NHN61294.1 sodium:calcium antiporter [Halorussus sp. JP-T4]